MRPLGIGAIFLLLVVSGCDDDATTPNQDLAMSVGDMTMKLSCAETLACVAACTNQSCAAACNARVSNAAATFWSAVGGCVSLHCAGTDAGAPSCSTNPSTSACQTCIMQNCASETATCRIY